MSKGCGHVFPCGYCPSYGTKTEVEKHEQQFHADKIVPLTIVKEIIKDETFNKSRSK